MKSSADHTYHKLIHKIEKGFVLLILLLLFLFLLLSIRLSDQNHTLRKELADASIQQGAMSASLAASGFSQAVSSTDSAMMRLTRSVFIHQIEIRRQESLSLQAAYGLSDNPASGARQLFVCQNNNAPRYSFYVVDPLNAGEPLLLADLYSSGWADYRISVMDLDDNGENDILLLAGDDQAKNLSIRLWLQQDGQFLAVDKDRIGGLTFADASIKLGLLQTDQTLPVPEYVPEADCAEVLTMLAQINELENTYAESADYGSIMDAVGTALREILFQDGRHTAADLYVPAIHGGLPYTQWRTANALEAHIKYSREYNGYAIDSVRVSVPRSRYSEAKINQWFLEYEEDKWNEIKERESLGYDYRHSLETRRADDAVLSFLEYDSYDCGSTYPLSDQKGFTFDLRTGEVLTLRGIMSDYDGFHSYVQRHLNDYDGQADGIYLVSRLLDGPDCPFYMTGFGITLLTGYSDSSGYVCFRLPYEEIAGYMKPEYLPVSPEAICEITETGLPADITGDGIPEYISYSQEQGNLVCMTISGGNYPKTAWPLTIPEDEAQSLAGYTPAGVWLSRDAEGGLRLAYELSSGGENGRITLLYNITGDNGLPVYDRSVPGDALSALTGA